MQANTGNPFTKQINISESAAGQSQVWIRFNWTGTWSYAWFIDNVCISEPFDYEFLESTIITQNGTEEQYGRIPQGQIEGDYNEYDPYIGATVSNIGANDIYNANILYQVKYNNEIISSSSLPSFDINTLETTTITENIEFNSEPGIYEYNFMINTDNDNIQSNNIEERKFEVTQNNGGLYSLDGIGVYDTPTISRMGTGSFTDATDGLIMSYYNNK